MDTKLTLKLNKNVVNKAKEYAHENNKSLSKMVESYLSILVMKINHEVSEEKKYDDIQISPFVKSMSSGVNIPANLDYKSEYSNYLTEKYK